MKSSSVVMILIFTLFLLLMSSLPVSADSIACNNGVASTGASKGEVRSKCGKPLDISQDTIENVGGGTWKTGETWTYVIGGCYREFIFTGNNLVRIKDGAAAR